MKRQIPNILTYARLILCLVMFAATWGLVTPRRR